MVPVAPPETQQPVHQRIGKNAHIAIGIDPQRTVPLGQPGPVGAVDQGNMSIDRGLPAEGAKELGLAKGVAEMIVASDRMGDPHVMIVDDDGQHVGRRFIAPQQHHVVELAVRHPDGTLHGILDDGLAFAGRLEADDRLDAGRRIAGIAVAPAPVIEHPATFRLGPLAHLRELFLGGVTAIGLSFVEQAMRRLDMAGATRELAHRLIVPVEPEPGEAIEDRGDRLLGGTAAVGILDPQQEAAAVVARKQPVEQRRPRAAYVEKSRRRRGEAGHDRHGGSSASRLVGAAAREAWRRPALTR